MENNKKRDFGFTPIKTLEEKIDDTQKPEVKKIIDGQEKDKTASPALDRLKAMQKFKLKADMVNITGEIDYEDFDIFKKILAEFQREDRYKKEEDKQYWTQKKLIAHYVSRGIKEDKKKVEKSI